MSVVEFKRPEKSEPHMSGEAVCAACKNEWVAVAPVGVPLFECPACGTMRGRMKYSVVPASGVVWKCDCECDVFRITTKSALCINCGIQRDFW